MGGGEEMADMKSKKAEGRDRERGWGQISKTESASLRLASRSMFAYRFLLVSHVICFQLKVAPVIVSSYSVFQKYKRSKLLY